MTRITKKLEIEKDKRNKTHPVICMTAERSDSVEEVKLCGGSRISEKGVHMYKGVRLSLLFFFSHFS